MWLCASESHHCTRMLFERTDLTAAGAVRAYVARSLPGAARAARRRPVCQVGEDAPSRELCQVPPAR